MDYKRILSIQDISCIGQCSMTVVLPVLSACGQETCILPAAVLSTHTGGFGKPVVEKLTQSLPHIWRHWQREGITFDAIYTGYLGSEEAVSCASEIMDSMLAPGGKIIVDPAMADHGKLYAGFDESYARSIGKLCNRADVILPNITEAAMLTGAAYRTEIDEAYIRKLLDRLDCRNVILTGVGFRPEETGAAIRTEQGVEFVRHRRIGRSYHGTGDLFAACFTGAWVGGKPLRRAVEIASEFTCRSIENTWRDPAHWYGVKFETALPDLIQMLEEA